MSDPRCCDDGPPEARRPDNRAGLPLEQLDTAPTRTGASLRDVLDFFPA